MHKYKKIFSNFSSQNEDFQSLKSPKNDSLLYNGHKTDVKYISSKLQVGNYLLFTKYPQILNIGHNIGRVRRTCLIYRPGMYNLQTRFASFPDQKKVAKSFF